MTALKIGTNRLDSRTVELYIELYGKSAAITPQEARFIARDLEGLADSAEKGRGGSSVTRPTKHATS
jgi:hypothetical protein